MNQLSALVARRFYDLAATAGAMPRFFIGVGGPEAREEITSSLARLGLEVIPSPLSGFPVFDEGFRQHQGTHFNRKIFVLTGLDRLVADLGDEIFRRLELERRMFERTATFSLLWIESWSVANRLRNRSGSIWEGSSDRAVIPTEEDLRPKKVLAPVASVCLESSVGKIFLPIEMEKVPEESNFWSDVIRLRSAEALLSAALLLSEGKAISAEMEIALKRMENLAGLRAEGSGDHGPKDSLYDIVPDWRGDGERAVRQADALAQKGDLERSIKALTRVLEGPTGYLVTEAALLADRPLRMRAMLYRASGKFMEAAQDIDRLELMAKASGIPAFLAAAWEARAMHVEELGDLQQAATWKEKAAKERLLLAS